MDKKEFQAKMLFYMMCKSQEEIAKVDEDFQDDIEDFEGKIQWRIASFKGYQIYKDGKYSFVIDEEIEEPDVVFTLEDVDKAILMFSGELDGTTAYMSGDLVIEGNLSIAIEMGSLSDYMAEYLEPLRPS